jgi:16S rRNA (cytosine967-C5)-methyltransferase
LAAPDARALAWSILQRVEGGAYADALIGRRLPDAGMAERDRGLATRLVYGTLAWQGYLDHILAVCARRRPESLDTPVRTLLRMALYQICFLSRVPDFASVDTAVELAKGYRGGAAAGLVNAVLRRAAVGWQGIRFPARDAGIVAHLATRLSHPRWLVARWVEAFGAEETAALLRANNEAAPTVLRAHAGRDDPDRLLERLRAAGHTVRRCAYSPLGLELEPSGSPEQLPGHAEGTFSIQGEASQLVGFLVGAAAGERVLDACAAPGGKTTQLAELMQDQGEVVAVDISTRGIERVRRMAHRLGLSCIRPIVGDLRHWAPPDAERLFDRVLVDAPCTGLGTLRQHPELKWRRTPENVAVLAQVQGELLERAATLVRPGGTLVYATCTLTAEENEQQVARLHTRHPEFGIDDPRPWLPPSARALVGTDDVLRTFPHRHGLDGFFAVRLKRRGGGDIVRA